jgi:hypothetical protein
MQVMSWMEQCAYISASRLRGSHLLTAGMDSVTFAASTKVGDILYITAQVSCNLHGASCLGSPAVHVAATISCCVEAAWLCAAVARAVCFRQRQVCSVNQGRRHPVHHGSGMLPGVASCACCVEAAWLCVSCRFGCRNKPW